MKKLKTATESELAKMLGTLGNKDAIKILRFAKSGFDGTTIAHKRLGLSVKQYYYRLDRLMNAGLIRKLNNRYELTPLGEIVWDTLERRMVWAIENAHSLSIVETLKRSKEIGPDAWQRMVTDLFGSEFAEISFGNPANTILTYEGLLDTTVKLTERAERKLCVATRYEDFGAIEAGWRAISRGVKIRSIDGRSSYMDRMKIVQMLVRYPRCLKMLYDLWHSEKIQIRFREIPFSFMVVDDRDCCFEIVNPVAQGFFAAVEIQNCKGICSKLMDIFDNLWQGSEEEDPIRKITEDLMKKARRARQIKSHS